MIFKHLKYILIYANEYVEFRLCEFVSLNQLYGKSIKYEALDFESKSPYIVVECPDQTTIVKIAQRSILIKSVLEFWGEGRHRDELILSMKKLSEDFLKPYQECSYRYRFYTYGKNLSPGMKLERMEAIDFLPLKGRIQLNQSDQSFYWLEYYNELSDTHPDKIYFGRWVTDGQRKALPGFSLSTRKYIGNTSMSPDLAFLMTNLAQVRPDDLVYDPFVGTGSLLVAAAQAGAYVMGTDVEPNMLMATGKSSRCGQGWKMRDENVRTNLRQYELVDRYVDVTLADSTLPLWRTAGSAGGKAIFDAILTDPPYGIRESSKKLSNYEPSDPDNCRGGTSSFIFSALLELAANLLVPGGKLVYWLPFVKEHPGDQVESATRKNVPSHPLLEMISCVHHFMFGKRVGRYLVTMTKRRADQAPADPELRPNEEAFQHLDSFRDKYFSPRTNAKTKG